MYLIYSLLLTIAFVVLLPRFLLDTISNGKYADGFWQRLGFLPEFKHNGHPLIWLHCVSVGETNAARPLISQLKVNFPNHRLVVSTTTKTGQELAKAVFSHQADSVFYFPFDWKFSVRRFLDHFEPDVILLMETEIWPRFIREAKRSEAKIAIVNGRLSAKSFKRYSFARRFVRSVLSNIDLALMQGENDARGFESLGVPADKIRITGNVKFDLEIDDNEKSLTENFRDRFGFSYDKPLIVAASTHSPEEKWIIEGFQRVYHLMEGKPRLLIAPRHPQRFDDVAAILGGAGFSVVRRSTKPSIDDKKSEVVLLDSIGELRAVYPLAEIVFVGGSLMPHGGQSILEPAAAGKAIITGPYTHNFDSVVREFLDHKALIQLPEAVRESLVVERIYETFAMLLREPIERDSLGSNAFALMRMSRGATSSTIDALKRIL